jgi:predicted small lipoprotein YifL
MTRHKSIFVVLVMLLLALAACGGPKATSTVPPACAEIPAATFQKNADDGVAAGAMIVYERSGGTDCVDEVWQIYPDGRIIGNNGRAQATRTITAQEASAMLADVVAQGFFKLPSTKHTACRECYTYHITVKSNDQVNTVAAVDGGTDTPTDYWQIFARIKKDLPAFP